MWLSGLTPGYPMQIQTLVLASLFNHTLKTGISASSLKHVRTAGERPWLQGKSKFCRGQFVIKKKSESH